MSDLPLYQPETDAVPVMCLEPNCKGYVLERKDEPGTWACRACGKDYGPPKRKA